MQGAGLLVVLLLITVARGEIPVVAPMDVVTCLGVEDVAARGCVVILVATAVLRGCERIVVGIVREVVGTCTGVDAVEREVERVAAGQFESGCVVKTDVVGVLAQQAFAHHVVDELLLVSIAEGLRGVATAVALVSTGEDEVAAHDEGELETEMVLDVVTELFAQVVPCGATVGVTRREIVLLVVALLRILVAVVDVVLEAVGEIVATVVEGDFATDVLVALAEIASSRVPVAVRRSTCPLVDVVEIAEQRGTQVVGEVETEQTGEVGFFSLLFAQSATHFGVGHRAVVVFAFQRHVHRVFTLFDITSQQTALVGLCFEHLDFLDRVVGQVVEHDTVASTEEVLAVEREVVNLAPVDEDLSVALQLHARQLLDESVEHRTFRHIERIGIIHHRVAAIGNLHLGGSHSHLVQLLFPSNQQTISRPSPVPSREGGVWLRRVIVVSWSPPPYGGDRGGLPLHIMMWRIQPFVAGRTHVVVDEGRLVVGMFGTDDDVLHDGGQREAIGGVVTHAWLCIAKHMSRVDDGAVGPHEGDERARNTSLGETVVDVSVQ